MRDKIFHRYVIIVVTLILILTVGVKVYTWESNMEVSQWNYEQLKRMDRNQTDLLHSLRAQGVATLECQEERIKSLLDMSRYDPCIRPFKED